MEVEQFAGGWYPLDRNTQTALDEGPDESGQLGFGAVVGDEVWDQTARVRVRIGPLSLDQYLDFLPQGSAFESLRALTQLFSNGEFDFEIQLILNRRDVPPCELGAEGSDAPQLGWHTYVKTRQMKEDASDTILQLWEGDWNGINLKSLIGKLNDSTRNTLEASAGLCLARTHYDIEVEHYLLKLLDQADGDFARIVNHFGIDKSRLTGELNRSLDKLKSGNSRGPPPSALHVVKMITEAWTIGSIDFDAGQVRTGFTVLGPDARTMSCAG